MDEAAGLEELGKRFEEVMQRIDTLEEELMGLRKERLNLQRKIVRRMENRALVQKDIPEVENKFSIPSDLWGEIPRNIHRKALNLIIETGEEGIIVADLAPLVDYDPKGVGGIVRALRGAASRVGVDPDNVVRRKRVFRGTKDQGLLISNLKVESKEAATNVVASGASAQR